jgi:hypothetical protein
MTAAGSPNSDKKDIADDDDVEQRWNEKALCSR